MRAAEAEGGSRGEDRTADKGEATSSKQVERFQGFKEMGHSEIVVEIGSRRRRGRSVRIPQELGYPSGNDLGELTGGKC